MSIFDNMPPTPLWDDEGSTIDMTPLDSIVAYVLDHHGIEIDWSTNDTAEQVGNQIGPGEAVEQGEIFQLLRTVAHVALNDRTALTANVTEPEGGVIQIAPGDGAAAYESLVRDANRHLPPETIAERVLDNHRIRPDWRRTGEQIIPLLAEAVRIARGDES